MLVYEFDLSRMKVLNRLDTLAPIAFQKFGSKAQMVKTIEELGELIQVLAKHINNLPVTDTQIIDEVADVLVVVGLLRHFLGPEKVDTRMLHKIDRTNDFISRLNQESIK